MITLRFSSHTGILNAAFTIAQYGTGLTHVEAVMPDGRYHSAMMDGVKSRLPGYDAGTIKREEFVEVRCTAEQEAIFYAFLETQVGKPYDTWAILAFFWPSRDWQSFDAWYCSEEIGAGLAECVVLPKAMAKKFSRVTVRDLLLLVSTRATS